MALANKRRTSLALASGAMRRRIPHTAADFSTKAEETQVSRALPAHSATLPHFSSVMASVPSLLTTTVLGLPTASVRTRKLAVPMSVATNSCQQHGALYPALLYRCQNLSKGRMGMSGSV